MGDHGVDVGAPLALLAHHEAPIAECLQHAFLCMNALGHSLCQRVGAELERAQPRAIDVMKLAQGAGGGIARIREGLELRCEPARVQALEGGDRQHDLPAHRDARRRPRRARERERQARTQLQVRGHVLADAAVAARRAHREHAVLVDEVDARAVQFWLGEVLDGLFAAEQPSDALVESAQLALVHGVVERQHRYRVRDRGKALGGRFSHALGRRVGPAQLGMCGLQLRELAQQPVIFCVGDLGPVERVVEPVVAVQLRDEGIDALARVVARHRIPSGARGYPRSRVGKGSRRLQRLLARGGRRGLKARPQHAEIFSSRKGGDRHEPRAFRALRDAGSLGRTDGAGPQGGEARSASSGRERRRSDVGVSRGGTAALRSRLARPAAGQRQPATPRLNGLSPTSRHCTGTDTSKLV